MSDIAALVSDHLDIWTAATERKNGAGRGGGKRVNLYGIERLRALILDLAVRGKLVPQDANDEPAVALLDKLKAERSELMKAELIGKAKSYPTVSQEPPFEIPAGWAWTQVSVIGHDWGQQEPVGDFTYIDVGSIDQRAGVVRAPSIVAAKDAPSRARKLVRKSTVIYSTVRPYLLNIAIVDQDFDPEPIASTAFAVVHPFSGVEAGFIYRYLRSPAFVRYVESCQTGIAYPAINDRQFFAAWCPLPPTAEQGRIVAKVDELMALCDALKGESAAALAAHQTLVETLLATLADSADAADLAANWSRLEAHFDTLFTTEPSVDALKQTILELAVRGRLTRPENEDGQVDQLLADIAEHRKVKAKQSRRRMADVPARAVSEAEMPFVIPGHWQFARFQDVLINRDAERIPVSFEERVGRKGEYDYYGASGVIDKIDRFLFEEPLLLIGEDGANLINRSTPIAFVARGKYWVNNHAHVLEACSETLLRYMEIFINAIDLKPYVTGTAQPKMNQAKMNSIIVALPPAEEMKRVVAKVDALMVLCDDLKARITDAGQIQMRLADTIVEGAAA